MNDIFEINSISKFETNVIVLNNVYDDPDIIRDKCVSRYRYGKNKTYGVQCIGYNEIESTSLISQLLKLFDRKITSKHEYLLFIDKYKNQKIHRDCEEEDVFACVIYLNKYYPVHTGTQIIDPLYEKIQHIDSNISDIDYVQYIINQYNLIINRRISIFINAEYNKMLLYPGNLWHSPLAGFGTDGSTSRLVQSSFIKTTMNH